MHLSSQTPYARDDLEGDVTARTSFMNGLNWCYAFCHEEAIRCFNKALEADGHYSLAHWGTAYAIGPNYNDFVRSEELWKRCYDSAQEAVAHAKAPLETVLANAMAVRFVWPVEQDRHHLDIAYSDAMREVYRTFPDDVDVACLFAESLLMLAPWRMWLDSDESIQMAAAEARQVLEKALQKNERHPGLLHMYVHLMELSVDFAATVPYLKTLEEVFPLAGHLVHMPSHIYVKLGDWQAAVESNEKAVEADEAYARARGVDTFYGFYRVHDYHMCIYSAMMAGRCQEARTYTARMLSPEHLISRCGLSLGYGFHHYIEPYVAVQWHTLVRFGLWDEILEAPLCPNEDLADSTRPDEDVPQPEDIYTSTIATGHYAKGVALAALGRALEAQEEQQLFLASAKRVSDEHLLHNVKSTEILEIAEHVLDGEVAFALGLYDKAFAQLRMAVVLNDNLPFDEPWGWMHPPRHALGALLLSRAADPDCASAVAESHRIEAERVFRVDLQRHPSNVWGLQGLVQSLTSSSKCGCKPAGSAGSTELAQLKAQLKKAQEYADVEVTTACACSADRNRLA